MPEPRLGPYRERPPRPPEPRVFPRFIRWPDWLFVVACVWGVATLCVATSC
jgi:hypothetical protein